MDHHGSLESIFLGQSLVSYKRYISFATLSLDNVFISMSYIYCIYVYVYIYICIYSHIYIIISMYSYIYIYVFVCAEILSGRRW